MPWYGPGECSKPGCPNHPGHQAVEGVESYSDISSTGRQCDEYYPDSGRCYHDPAQATKEEAKQAKQARRKEKLARKERKKERERREDEQNERENTGHQHSDSHTEEVHQVFENITRGPNARQTLGNREMLATANPSSSTSAHPQLGPTTTFILLLSLSLTLSPFPLLLSSLPTELVRQIIESSVPSTFHSTTYKERQSSLRYLCLVSRLFLSIAQPLLFEIIWSYSPESLDAALEALGSEQGGKAARYFLLTYEENCPYLPDRFDKRAQHLSGICHLVLEVEGEDKLELASLQLLPNLAILQLSGGGYKLSSPFVLVKVHTLTLDDEVLEIVTDSLDPENLPSLRNLALFDIHGYQEALELQTHRFFDLLPQLTTFYSDWELAKTSPDLWRDYLEHILFHSYGFDLSNFTNLQFALRQLRIYKLFSNGDDDSTALRVRQFVDWIKSGKAPSLRSIYLDADLQESEKVSRKQASLFKGLQIACKERNIEVIFEKQGDDWGVDSMISEVFCRRQEARRKIGSVGTH